MDNFKNKPQYIPVADSTMGLKKMFHKALV